MDEADREAALIGLIRADPARMRLLALVRAHGPPGAWIAAGTLREAVWDDRHGRPPRPPEGDVDVVWFDRRAGVAEDRRFERCLADAAPAVHWSVKNQARMHARNGDPPYASLSDALRCWPEPATAVAARLDAEDAILVLAPFGLAELFDLVVGPTPHFAGSRRAAHEARVRDKGWLARWPRLSLRP